MALDQAEDQDTPDEGAIRSAVAALMKEQSRDPYDAGVPEAPKASAQAAAPVSTAKKIRAVIEDLSFPELDFLQPEAPIRVGRWAQAPRSWEDLPEPGEDAPVAPDVSRRRSSRIAGPGRLSRAEERAVQREEGTAPARFRLRPRHAGLLVFLAVIYLYFWAVVGVVFFAVWLGLGIWLMLGHDRVEAIGARWLAGREARAPGTQEELRARAERNVGRLESFLARLPGRWQDRVMLPDFSEPQLPAGEPLNRLHRSA
ncbi:hypothetical protein [Mesobacterium pallidum]|uniref:hypothetical protein n=1 Tax=Mesobacterium pallidum TaxID=2872037 RepID=UPI001EE2D098|nr:hypothetical protein [Mesobacterium pallidum]